MSTHETDGFNNLLPLSIIVIIPVLCVPNANCHVIWASEQDVTIFSDASHWVFVSHHCAEVLACLQLVDLDLFGVASYYKIPVSFILIEVKTQHFLTFEKFQILDFSVVNSMTELRVDCCCELSIWAASLLSFLTYLPNTDGSIITSSNQKLLILKWLTRQTTDRIGMVTSFLRFQ